MALRYVSMASSMSLNGGGSNTLNTFEDTYTWLVSPLLIVDTGQVAMDNGMVRTECECSEVGSHGSVEYPSLLKNITKVDVSI